MLIFNTQFVTMSTPHQGTRVLWAWGHHFLDLYLVQCREQGGGGGRQGWEWVVEGKKEIKRPINICQTLKCKSLACGPVGTKSSIITFLGRAPEVGVGGKVKHSRSLHGVVWFGLVRCCGQVWIWDKCFHSTQTWKQVAS